MTIEDNKKYKLTGEQIKDLASRFGVLSGDIGDLANLTTTDKTNLVAAINEAAAGGGGSGPTVVQTTGTSTTDVMSQNAVSSMVYPTYSTQGKTKIAIGNNAEVYTNFQSNIAIGVSANANNNFTTVIGNVANASGERSTAVGNNSRALHDSSIAIGDSAITSFAGEMNIGAGSSGRGYNSSNYRLLTGLYDPQSAHDAATKGYVDGLVGNIASALNAINNGGGN